jgi:hypothetical protein
MIQTTATTTEWHRYARVVLHEDESEHRDTRLQQRLTKHARVMTRAETYMREDDSMVSVKEKNGEEAEWKRSSLRGREVLRVAGDDAEKERRRSSGRRAVAQMGSSGAG